MVISLTVPAKSLACSIAMSRFTRVSQAVMLPKATTIISQITPVRRGRMRHVGKSIHVQSRGPAIGAGGSLQLSHPSYRPQTPRLEHQFARRTHFQKHEHHAELIYASGKSAPT